MNKKEFFEAYEALEKRVDTLTAINADLLSALELVIAHDGKLTGADFATINAAIAKART